ncbi:MAG TPA: hypothetical protein VKV17_04500 [Bryobacteraceae bacterium]|nr:hypothetical protein [Bryobacteraceae bacterium]
MVFATPRITAVPPDESLSGRYEALIRIANLIHGRKNPNELFGILVQELRQLVPFDGIAQFDEASHKVRWHLGPGCREPGCRDEEGCGETLPAWVYREQQAVVLGSLEATR